MAKRNNRGAAASARSTKATSRRAKPSPMIESAEVEVVEEAAGEGIDTAVAVVTTVILVVAILFVDALLGHFGAGVFFS